MVRQNPAVSIVIIFLNGERFIREAIDSVLSQTFQDWELLLVDDGSTDSSTAIARQYAGLYPGRIRYLEHQGHLNRGMSATRNLGVHNARGELIAFLDCDDFWLPQKLERQVAILKLNPEAGMVFGACQYWHSWADHEGTRTPDFIPPLDVPGNTTFQPPELLCEFYPLGDKMAAPCPSDLLIRRTAFDKAGGFQEEFHGIYSLYEDQAFLAKMYLHEAIFVSGECWTRYRIHPGSCVSTVLSSGQYPVVRHFFLKYLDRYLTAERVQDQRIWALLRKALRKLRWQLRVASGNIACLELPPEEPNLARVAISEAQTKDPWDIQLNQANLTVREGHSYSIAFEARADSPRVVNLGFSRAHGSWDSLGLYRSIELTTEWQAHNLEFVATADDRNARIHFDLGGTGISVDLLSLALYGLPDRQIIEPDFKLLRAAAETI